MLKQYERNQKLIDAKIPELDLKINIVNLDIKLMKLQFTQIMQLMNHLKKYLNQATVEKNKNKYKFLRPIQRIVYCQGDQDQKSEVIANWFYYFARVKAIKQMDKTGQSHAYDFLRPNNPRFEEYKAIFLKRFEDAKEDKWKAFVEEEQDLYQLVVLSFTEDALKDIVTNYATNKWQKWKIEEAENAKKGYFSGYFGSSKSNKLTDEETKEIEE